MPSFYSPSHHLENEPAVPQAPVPSTTEAGDSRRHWRTGSLFRSSAGWRPKQDGRPRTPASCEGNGPTGDKSTSPGTETGDVHSRKQASQQHPPGRPPSSASGLAHHLPETMHPGLGAAPRGRDRKPESTPPPTLISPQFSGNLGLLTEPLAKPPLDCKASLQTPLLPPASVHVDSSALTGQEARLSRSADLGQYQPENKSSINRFIILRVDDFGLERVDRHTPEPADQHCSSPWKAPRDGRSHNLPAPRPREQ